jgi:hypothetical protein
MCEFVLIPFQSFIHPPSILSWELKNAARFAFYFKTQELTSFLPLLSLEKTKGVEKHCDVVKSNNNFLNPKLNWCNDVKKIPCYLCRHL